MINSVKKDKDRKFEYDYVQADVVVIGAGIAGIASAISAARQGVKTVLVTDRPILGGSASSEIRVGPGGADSPPWNCFARETGIVEEIFNCIHYKAQNSGKWRWHYFDQIYFDIVMNEPNLFCFLNTTIYKVNKDKQDIIKSIEGIQLRSEKNIIFKGKIFIDCSGDGVVGYLGGANFRMGRESKKEFNELFSPEAEDEKTMGATLLFTSVNVGHPIKYEAPLWSIKLEDLPSLPRLKHSMQKMPDGTFYGFWWAEYGGELDSIHNDDEIILHLRKLVNGIWDYIKNSGLYKDVENQEINWIGYLPGKRESRRLIGKYLATSADFLSQKKFDDKIGFTGWPIDVHPPEGYLNTEYGCTHLYLPGICDIPFRCIYSENIRNLMFAGRNISATHEALGTLRVIPTTAVMGQAAGIASAICIENNIFPDDIYNNHICELRSRLARTDQSITGYRLIEKNDFSRNAVITASSVRKVVNEKRVNKMKMEKYYGLILPVATKEISEISFYLRSDKRQVVSLFIYSCDEKCENYRIKEKFKTVSAEIKDEAWYDFKIDFSAQTDKKIFLLFDKNPMVDMFFSDELMTGILGIEISQDNMEFKYDTIFLTINSDGNIPYTPCFKIKPEQDFYLETNINDGYVRPYGLPHIWCSDKKRQYYPEWIRLDFDGEKTITQIELVFNSELNHKRLSPTINRVNSEMVKGYEIIAINNEGESVIVSEKNNYKRFVVHKIEPICVKALKLVVHETWGSEYAQVYDIRVY